MFLSPSPTAALPISDVSTEQEGGQQKSSLNQHFVVLYIKKHNVSFIYLELYMECFSTKVPKKLDFWPFFHFWPCLVNSHFGLLGQKKGAPSDQTAPVAAKKPAVQRCQHKQVVFLVSRHYGNNTFG